MLENRNKSTETKLSSSVFRHVNNLPQFPLTAVTGLSDTPCWCHPLHERAPNICQVCNWYHVYGKHLKISCENLLTQILLLVIFLRDQFIHDKIFNILSTGLQCPSRSRCAARGADRGFTLVWLQTRCSYHRTAPPPRRRSRMKADCAWPHCVRR